MSKLNDTLSALLTIDDINVVNFDVLLASEGKPGVMFGHYTPLIMVAPKSPRGLYTAETLQEEMTRLRRAIPNKPHLVNKYKQLGDLVTFGELKYSEGAEVNGAYGSGTVTRKHSVRVYPNEAYARDLFGSERKLPSKALFMADSTTLDHYRKIAEQKSGTIQRVWEKVRQYLR